MDIHLADVTIHIDETLDPARRGEIETQIRAVDGVVSVHSADRTPHLAIVEYNPEKTTSSVILDTVTAQGVHAEMIGL
ncbi:MAG: ATP-binding protein [Pseudomonadota bacterium]